MGFVSCVMRIARRLRDPRARIGAVAEGPSVDPSVEPVRTTNPPENEPRAGLAALSSNDPSVEPGRPRIPLQMSQGPDENTKASKVGPSSGCQNPSPATLLQLAWSLELGQQAGKQLRN